MKKLEDTPLGKNIRKHIIIIIIIIIIIFIIIIYDV